jgi:hypothetical protein
MAGVGGPVSTVRIRTGRNLPSPTAEAWAQLGFKMNDEKPIPKQTEAELLGERPTTNAEDRLVWALRDAIAKIDEMIERLKGKQ